ncbi:MAG: M23 family metallopeptidase [Alphaproteobacteria bacterium]|nr:M23 family metallopeptidase [Alphaproteobacteria bacterium]
MRPIQDLGRRLCFMTALLCLAGCQTEAPLDTTFTWNLASDPQPSHHYATSSARELREDRAPRSNAAPAWYSARSVRVERATLSPISFAPANEAAAVFAWPLRGRIISGFGSRTSGERNDGINIAVPAGTPIRASASGTVSYAGDELKSYGNLVLISHAGGYVTAYAHARKIVVNRGEAVSAGQVIGFAGSSGDVTESQLHFEIRHGTAPVDPRPLLAGSSTTS